MDAQQVKDPTRSLLARPERGISTAPAVRLFVYGLVDPRTNVVRYVGKSDDPRRRLAEHCDPNAYCGNLRKRRWIAELRESGLIPSIRVLQICDSIAACDAAERQEIEDFHRRGEADTNMAAGGATNRAVPSLANTRTVAWFDAASEIRAARHALESARATLDADGAGAAVYGAILAAIQAVDSSRLKLGAIAAKRFPGWPVAEELFYAEGDEYGR
jgi:hypothetical protein